MIRKRHCQVAYDRSAPIAKWGRIWTPFATLDACEAIRSELVKRVTAPGREEGARAAAQERAKSLLDAERRLRKDAKHDPEAKKMLAMLPGVGRAIPPGAETMPRTTGETHGAWSAWIRDES